MEITVESIDDLLEEFDRESKQKSKELLSILDKASKNIPKKSESVEIEDEFHLE